MSKRIFNRYWLIVVLISVLFSIRSVVFVLFGNTWLDEGGYMFDVWWQSIGNLLYVDFWVKTGPLMYLTYGWIQSFVGFNFITGRLISVGFSVLLLFTTYWFVKNVSNKWLGLLSVAILVSNSFVMHLYSTATPYAMTMFLFMGGLAVMSSRLKKHYKIILATLLFSLSALTRTNIIPLLVFFGLYLLFFEDIKSFLLSVFVSVVTFIIILFPFLSKGFDETIHAVFGTVINVVYPLYDVGIVGNPSSTFENLVSFSGIVHFNLFQFILLLLGLVILVPRYFRKDIFSFVKSNKSEFLLLFMFAVSFVIHTYGQGGTNKIYWVYSAPLAAAIAAISIGLIWTDLNLDGRKVFALVLIGGLFLSPAVFELRDLSNPSKQSDLNRLDQVGLELVEIFGDDKVLVFGNTLHVAYTGKLNTYPQLTHRNLMYVELVDTETVDKYHFFNSELLSLWLESSDGVLVSSNSLVLENYSPEVLELVTMKLVSDFELIIEIEDAYPKKYDFENSLLVYKRKL
jgi:4-amino-4-deoxy-L-arabinose transferase-like glycosyltransferase